MLHHMARKAGYYYGYYYIVGYGGKVDIPPIHLIITEKPSSATWWAPTPNWWN